MIIKSVAFLQLLNCEEIHLALERCMQYSLNDVATEELLHNTDEALMNNR